jgi:hypothetical protein
MDRALILIWAETNEIRNVKIPDLMPMPAVLVALFELVATAGPL